MTTLLQKAFEEAGKLSEEDQNALAAGLLEDLVAEERWDETLTQSQDKLALLAREALAEYTRGETKPLVEDLELSDD
jgi:hypothetical protein